MDGLPPGYFDAGRYQNAISYGRFSSAQQASGQSRERQTEALQATLQRFGWRLLDQYFDHGISAGRGKHRAVGALSRLLRRVREREIPTPCVLIVETFDRLSREELTVAQEQFLALINHGMAVYTTMDGAGYDKESLNVNPGALYASIGMMLGASGVYKVMANRAEKGWVKRRGMKTAMCPGWLRLNADGSDYDMVEGAQDTLDRIFEEAQYIGLDKLAARLNQDRVPPFETWNHEKSRGIWYDKHLSRIIMGRTVRGEVEIGKYEWKVKHKTVNGEVIEYETPERKKTGVRVKIYPAPISEEVWQRTNDALRARATGQGRKGTAFSNLFQGLAECWVCGGPMNLKSCRKKGGIGTLYQYYRCDMRHRRSACVNEHVYDYALVEKHLLDVLAKQALEAELPRDDKASSTRREIADLRADVDSLRQQREWTRNLIREAAKKRKSATDIRPSDVRQQNQLDEIDQERDTKLAQIAKLEQRLAKESVIEPAQSHYERVKQLIAQMPTLPDDERYTLRAKINAGMKSFLAKITFDEDGTVRLCWLPHPETKVGRVWEMLFRDGKWLWNERMIAEQRDQEEFERVEREEVGDRPRMRKRKDGSFDWVYPIEDMQRRYRDRQRRLAKKGIPPSPPPDLTPLVESARQFDERNRIEKQRQNKAK